MYLMLLGIVNEALHPNMLSPSVDVILQMANLIFALLLLFVRLIICLTTFSPVEVELLFCLQQLNPGPLSSTVINVVSLSCQMVLTLP